MLNTTRKSWSHRRVALGVVAALLLAACGSDDKATTTTSAAAETTTAETVAPETTVADTTAPTDAPETTGAADTTAAPDTTTGSGECREIEHVLGTACVPAHPQRIVVLDSLQVLPTLLVNGASVVGSVSTYDAGDPFPTFIDPELLEGVEVIGSLQTPNIEKIASLKPDLIIGNQLVMGPMLEQLEAIAPSVATHYAFYVSTWRDDMLLAADAAGVLDKAEQSLADFDARVAELRSTLTANGEGPTLSRVDVFAGSLIYYRYACSAFGEVLLSVGIRQPEAQVGECTDNDYATVLQYPSLEQVDIFDADVIVAYQQQAGANDVGSNPLDLIETSPLWATLPAVRDGNVHVVGDHWGLGNEVIAFNLMLDDIERFFGV